MKKSETTILGSVGVGGKGEELTLEESWKRFEERKAKVFAKAKLRAQLRWTRRPLRTPGPDPTVSASQPGTKAGRRA
jgi:hypothetical protein